MAEKKSLFANGGNGGQIVTTGNPITDLERAQDVARRYRCEFVDLSDFQLHHELYKKIPVELMFRYNFVPLEETTDGRLAIAIADPSQLMMIDEISLLLQKRIVTKVSTLRQISDILKKTEQSQRVLEEASEGFTIIREDEATGAEEALTIDKLTATTDNSPIIRLVDSTIFTALQRRASDIHIETRDDTVVIKYRIDGVLQAAMPPIAKEHHSTIISRVKVMAELDIAEKRVPQDGRFRVKLRGRYIDFRVSIMPSVHGEDAVIRILDKESLSEQFSSLRLDVLGFDEKELSRFRRFIPVHANNVIDVLGRFLNMKIEPYNFVSALNCVQAQRLVRTICVHCKRKVKASPEVLTVSGLAPATYGDVWFYEGAGCLECAGTGYKGRTAISELLDLSDNVRELILARRSSAEIKKAAKEEGMVFLRESAVTAARAGKTTLHEINKVTFVEVA